jgi:hypothetical protein
MLCMMSSYAFILSTRLLCFYIYSLFYLLYSPIATMSSKYCSSCMQKRLLPCFLKDALASPTSRVYSTCIQCRDKAKASRGKRPALQPLDPNIQLTGTAAHARPQKRVRRSNTGLQPTILAGLPLDLPVERPPLQPPTEPRPPQAPVTALPLDLPVERPPLEPPAEPRPPHALVTALPLAEPAGFLPADE